jgi:hypothetical protein
MQRMQYLLTLLAGNHNDFSRHDTYQSDYSRLIYYQKNKVYVVVEMKGSLAI